MKIKYHELEDDGYIPRTTFHVAPRGSYAQGGDGKGWHSPRIGRTKPGGHILKFSMTERVSSYFIVSRFHRKFRALAATRARPDRHFPSGRVSLPCSSLVYLCLPLANERSSGIFFACFLTLRRERIFIPRCC